MSRIAIVDKAKCKPDKCNHECIKRCPPQKSNGNVIDIENIVEGLVVNRNARINENTCIGCNMYHV